MKILLVDDEANLLDMTKTFLEKENERFNIDSTTSAKKALDFLSENDYDVVVSDYAMPEMDGLELLEELRKETDIPFILFTGRGREEVAMQALNLGADRYLQKGHDVRVAYGMLADAIIQEAEHYKSENKRRRAEQRYKLIAKHMPNGIVHILDQNLRFVFSAGEMLDKIGLSNEELIGKTVSEVLPEDTAKMVESYYQRALKGEPVTFEGDYAGKHFLLNVIPLEENAGEMEGILVLAVDITERRNMEEEREQLIGELRTINKTIVAASRTEGVNKICQMIAETVHQLNKDSIVATTLYNREIERVTIRALVGPGEIRNRVLKLFGDRITQISLDPNEMGEASHLYTTGKLERIPGGIYTLMAGKASQTLCNTAERIMGIDSAYAIGFALGNKPYGGITILPPRGQEVRHKSAIETLTSHVSEILQRRQTEEELRRSEAIHRAIFENTGTATAFLDEDMTISLMNSKCEELSGYSKEEIEGKMKWTKFVREEDLERMKRYHKLRRKDPESVPNRYEFHFVTKSGEVKLVDLLISMIPRTKKSIASLVDITEYKDAQKEIENLNSLLMAIRNINQVIVQESDFKIMLQKICEFLVETRGYLGCSIAFCEEGDNHIRPLASTGKLRKSKEWAITPEGEGTAPDCVIHTLSTSEMQVIENTVGCTDCSYIYGEREWHRNILVPMISDEKPVGLLRVVVSRQVPLKEQEKNLLQEVAGDILFAREKHEAELRLRQSERRARSIMEASLDAIALLDKNGRVIDCNTRYAARLGKKPDDIIGNTTWKLHRDVSTKRREALESVFKTGESYHGEDVREGKNGEPVWNEYVISPIQDESGNIQYVCLYARDITKRKKAELQLKASEHEKQIILDSSPGHILFQDLDHKVIWANKVAAESLDMEPKNITGERCHELWANREMPCKECPVERALQMGKPCSGEMKTPDGRWWLITGNPVENEEGRTIGAVEITLDITARKHAERRTDFLLSLLRHDVLNRIQAVQGFLDLLKHTNLTENQADTVEKALAGTREQMDIIERVRLLREVEEEEDTRDIAIKSVIKSVIKQKNLRPFGTGVSIETFLPEEKVKAQGGKLLKPLFTNLIENSLEHSEGNEIKISVNSTDNEVIVSVEDDGKGIPEKVQKEIIQAHFDDEETETSGLGLYLVKEIAEAYGGRIEIGDSKLGGARVDVHLKKSE